MSSTYDLTTGRVHFISLGREVVHVAYWYLPRVLAVGFIWSLLSVTLVLVAPATAVAFAASRSILDRESFGVRDAGRAFVQYFWRAQAAFVPAFIQLTITWWLWYLAVSTTSLALTLVAFLAFDVLVLYCYLMLYYGPLLVDETVRRAVLPAADRATPSALTLARASATVAVTNVRASVGLFFFLGSLAALLAFTVVGFAFLAPGILTITTLLTARYVFGEGETSGGAPK